MLGERRSLEDDVTTRTILAFAGSPPGGVKGRAFVGLWQRGSAAHEAQRLGIAARRLWNSAEREHHASLAQQLNDIGLPESRNGVEWE